MRGVLVLFGLLALVDCRSAPPPTPVAGTPIDVATARRPRAAMFGRTDQVGRFLRITEIPLVDGTSFGWRLDLRCTGPVLFRETMLLPTPGDWTFTPEDLPETTISNGGKTATTYDYVACRDGWIEHSWRVARGDPPGEWIVTIEIEGYEPTVFRPKFLKR